MTACQNKRYWIAIWIVFFTLSTEPTKAEPPYERSAIFIDSVGHTFTDILMFDSLGYFTPCGFDYPIFDAQKTYWFKCELYTSYPSGYYYITPQPVFEHLQAYYFRQNKHSNHVYIDSSQVLGYKRKHIPTIQATREYATFYLEKDVATSIYFKIKPSVDNKHYLYNTFINQIHDSEAFLPIVLRENISYSVLVAILAFVAIFVFIVALKIKDLAYFFYFFYLISSIGFLTTMYYLAFQIFEPIVNSYWDVMDTYAFFFSLMTVFILLYTNAYLKLHKRNRKIFTVILIACAVKVMLYLLGFFIHPKINSTIFHSPVFDTILLGTGLWAGIEQYLIKKEKYILYFVFGMTTLYIGFFYHSYFREFSLSWLNIYVKPIFFFVVLENIFFCIGLADRFRMHKQEAEQALKKSIEQLHENIVLREKMNAELELKVAERTQTILKQAEELKSLNLLLLKNNLKLKENVKDLSVARVTKKPVGFEEFKKTYPDEEACEAYLADLKWGAGFVCRKCKNTQYVLGKTPFARRCNRCWYEETPTVGTIFHKLKFPIEKAFYLLFLVTENPKISIEELAKLTEVSERTCWSYKNKILAAIEANKKGKIRDVSWEKIILFKQVNQQRDKHKHGMVS